MGSDETTYKIAYPGGEPTTIKLPKIVADALHRQDMDVHEFLEHAFHLEFVRHPELSRIAVGDIVRQIALAHAEKDILRDIL